MLLSGSKAEFTQDTDRRRTDDGESGPTIPVGSGLPSPRIRWELKNTTVRGKFYFVIAPDPVNLF